MDDKIVNRDFLILNGQLLSANSGKNKDPKKVAKEFEAFFVYLLLKEMKRIATFSKRSLAEDTYMDILYQKVAEYVSEREEGMRELILRYMRNGDAKELKKRGDKITKGVKTDEG
jgi:Rod binding domain-containing protein